MSNPEGNSDSVLLNDSVKIKSFSFILKPQFSVADMNELQRGFQIKNQLIFSEKLFSKMKKFNFQYKNLHEWDKK